MRWLTTAVALLAGAQVYGIVLQQRSAAQVAVLAGEIRDLRAQEGRGGGPVTLAPEEHLVLEQMMASHAAKPSPAERKPEVVAAAPSEPTASQRAAMDGAASAVEAVLSSGNLRRDDTMELRRLLAQADPGAAGELRKRIAAAINRDELKLEAGAGLP
jgi:hypothetical protein